MLAKLNLGWNLIFKTFKKAELYHRWGKRKPHTKNPHWPDIKISMTKGLIVFLAKSGHGLNSLKTVLHLNICYDTLHIHIVQIFSLGF
jgi:hypothetical protein